MSHVNGEAPGQSSLFPASLNERIPDDHRVRVTNAYVARLDLAAPGFAKTVTRATGRPPYDPADLLKRYLSGYLHPRAICTVSVPRVGWQPDASAPST